MPSIDYQKIANDIRQDVLNMVTKGKVGFVGSAFSAADILTVLYFGIMSISPETPCDENRDIFIMSKGHAASLLYAILAKKGFFSKEELSHFCEDGYYMGPHLRYGHLPGIEMSSGSLGHGLGVACGIACANKIINSERFVYVLMGDGECNEGSVWEAAMFAAKQKLSHLVAVVDRNKLQSYGRDEDVLNMGNLAEKFFSFGWNVIEIDGHDYDQIYDSFKGAQVSLEKPTVIVANTIKGKGVSFMEDRLIWHYKWPSEADFTAALQELQKGKEDRIR